METTSMLAFSVVTLLFGVGLGWILSRVMLTGEGAWDGRSGGEISSRNAQWVESEMEQIKEFYFEYHIVWIWRKGWWHFNRLGLEKLCRRAQYVFAGQKDENGDDPNTADFWCNICKLKDDPAWAEAVDAVHNKKTGFEGWIFRAYADRDERGREYRAIEATARFFLPFEKNDRCENPAELMLHYLEGIKLTDDEWKCLHTALEETFKRAAGLRGLIHRPS